MTALALTLAGLAPGFFVALLYWVPRAAMRARARVLEDAGQQALPERPRSTTVPDLHIEVLKLRAAKLTKRLEDEREHRAKHRVEGIIASGDREALIAILREENG